VQGTLAAAAANVVGERSRKGRDVVAPSSFGAGVVDPDQGGASPDRVDFGVVRGASTASIPAWFAHNRAARSVARIPPGSV